MPQFLEEFFPNVAAAQHAASGTQRSAYCTFDDPGLQAWTSSMFIAGAVTGERFRACVSMHYILTPVLPHVRLSTHGDQNTAHVTVASAHAWWE